MALTLLGQCKVLESSHGKIPKKALNWLFGVFWFQKHANISHRRPRRWKYFRNNGKMCSTKYAVKLYGCHGSIHSPWLMEQTFLHDNLLERKVLKSNSPLQASLKIHSGVWYGGRKSPPGKERVKTMNHVYHKPVRPLWKIDGHEIRTWMLSV